MSFLQALFKESRPPPVPSELPNLTLTTAQIVRSCEPGPAALKLLTPQQTPAQFLTAMQEQWLGDDMVKFLVYGLPDRLGVMWAAQGAARVADKLPPLDAGALAAAQAWLANPSAATQAAAAAAAKRTEMTGPGAWVAQAAAWAKPENLAGGLDAAVLRLAPNAVFGAVLLSAAIAANPKLALPKIQPAPPALPEIAVPGLAVPGMALPRPAVPSLAAPSGALPETTVPKFAVPPVAIPQVPSPTLTLPKLAAPHLNLPPVVPPKVQMKMFWERYPFIALGLALASGKPPAA